MKLTGWVTTLVVLVIAGTITAHVAAQGWGRMGSKRSSPAAVTKRVDGVLRPQATIGGGANGAYCTATWDNGIAVHDLGFMPSGINVTVTVEGLNDGFNPVAAVVVATIGQAAGNNVRATTFYDDDSGGDGDPRVQFVTPQAGTYLLMVNDATDSVIGCYRYQVLIG
jgi:hypothetical protein